jgi:hypothetical protein
MLRKTRAAAMKRSLLPVAEKKATCDASTIDDPHKYAAFVLAKPCVEPNDRKYPPPAPPGVLLARARLELRRPLS